MRYVSGLDEQGHAIDVRDPLQGKIQMLVSDSDEKERVGALLSLNEIFGDDLPKNEKFVENIQPGLAATHSPGRTRCGRKLALKLTINALNVVLRCGKPR